MSNRKGNKHESFIDRTGEKHTNNEGCNFEIIECINTKSCTVQFEDGTTLKNIQYGHIKRGTVSNPYHPSVYGVGYRGIGRHVCTFEGKDTTMYKVWNQALKRSYDNNTHLLQPTYKQITVCEEWINFQNFGDWFELNYIEGYELDKDILIKGNKIYSPETCCFVPKVINTVFTKSNKTRGKYPIGVHFHNKNKNYVATIRKNGFSTYLGTFNTPEEAFQTYKKAKEIHIKELADEWKPYIKENTYNALYNYQVEITD